MKLSQIEEVVNLLKDTDIYEFKWENPKIKLFLSRLSTSDKAAIEVESTEENYGDNEDIEIEETTYEEESVNKSVQIKSKMVGTFYSSPMGSTKEFVKRGTKVKKGQVICIIEAMKIIKEVQSEFDGKILDTYLESGQPVEYGQNLFTIQPD